jgi:hypothetical protein
MKVDYNSNTKQYELSDEQGVLSSDESLEALSARHGVGGDEDEEILPNSEDFHDENST